MRYRSNLERHRSNLMGYRSDLMRYRSNLMRHRSNLMRYRSDLMRHRSNLMRHRSNLVRYRSNLMRHRSKLDAVSIRSDAASIRFDAVSIQFDPISNQSDAVSIQFGAASVQFDAISGPNLAEISETEPWRLAWGGRRWFPERWRLAPEPARLPTFADNPAAGRTPGQLARRQRSDRKPLKFRQLGSSRELRGSDHQFRASGQPHLSLRSSSSRPRAVSSRLRSSMSRRRRACWLSRTPARGRLPRSHEPVARSPRHGAAGSPDSPR